MRIFVDLLKKTANKIVLASLGLGLFLSTPPAFAVQTICDLTGYDIDPASVTNIPIFYGFADAGQATDVDLQLSVSYNQAGNYIGDISAELTNPDGTTVMLFERPGTPNLATQNAGPWGCFQGNIDNAIFDDDPPAAIQINGICNNPNPAIPAGRYLTDQDNGNAAQSMADFDGEAVAGTWTFTFYNAYGGGDTGTMDAACLTVTSASILYNQWVSTTSDTCADQLESITVGVDDPIYVCYTISNPGDVTWSLSAPDWNDTLGNDLTLFEDFYFGDPTFTMSTLDNTTLPAIPSFLGGDTDFPVGTTVYNSDVTVDGPGVPTPILTSESISVTVNGIAMDYDQWVSTDLNCADQLDSISVDVGTSIYVCYTLTNTSFTDFSLDGTTPDWTDSLGNDLSGLELTYLGDPTFTSQTVTFGPFIAGGSEFPIGSTAGTSTATVFSSGGGATTNDTENVLVTVTSPPASGVKNLYLNTGLTLTRTIPTAAVAFEQLGELATRTWTINPNTFSDLDITGGVGANIIFNMYVRRVGGNNNRPVSIDLADTNGVFANYTGTLVLTTTVELRQPALTVSRSPIVSGPITLTVTNTYTGPGNRRLRIVPSDGLGIGGQNSHLAIPLDTVINVDTIEVYDAAYPAGVIVGQGGPGPVPADANQAVFFRSVVSDPFGNFDIPDDQVRITVDDSSPTTVINNQLMNMVDDTTEPLKTFEYVGYSIPAIPNVGTWSIAVEAFEGEELTVSHTGGSNFEVGSPTLEITKDRDVATQIPGGLIQYTIVIENTYIGDAENVYLDDTPSIFEDTNIGSFVADPDCAVAGLSMPIGGPTTTLDGDGDIIRWEMTMVGTMSGNTGGFNHTCTITYTSNIEN